MWASFGLIIVQINVEEHYKKNQIPESGECRKNPHRSPLYTIRFILTCQFDKHSRMIHTIRLCWETNFNDYIDVILTIYTIVKGNCGENMETIHVNSILGSFNSVMVLIMHLEGVYFDVRFCLLCPSSLKPNDATCPILYK